MILLTGRYQIYFLFPKTMFPNVQLITNPSFKNLFHKIWEGQLSNFYQVTWFCQKKYFAIVLFCFSVSLSFHFVSTLILLKQFVRFRNRAEGLRVTFLQENKKSKIFFIVTKTATGKLFTVASRLRRRWVYLEDRFD